MTKKQYFYLLWTLSSIPTVIGIILTFTTGEYLNVGDDPEALRASTGIVFSIALGVLEIMFRGFLVTIGLYFAERIGAPFLLLNDNYDLKKDILKPAIIVGTVVSCIVVAIDTASPFELFSFPGELPGPFYGTLISLVNCIVYDVNLLLLWIAGLALLIKKVTNNADMDLIVYTSIVLIAFLFNMSSPIWHFGITAFIIGPMIRSGIDVVLGVLFWKKGFETAVLCHLVMILIFYLIAPMAMNFIAA